MDGSITTSLRRSMERSGIVLVLAMTVGAAAQSPPAGVTLESRVDAARNGSAVVTNRARVPLAAYLLDVLVEPCSPMQPRSILRAVDAVIATGTPALAPSQSRSEPLGSSPCNKVGAATPARAELRAAIFADGSTSGDPASVALLVRNRRVVLEQCEILLERLNAADAAAKPSDLLIADLRARLAVAPEQRPVPFDPVVDLVALASAHLDGPPADRIARSVAALEGVRRSLLDSKPPLR